MRNYYYLDFQNQQIGPITYEELRRCSIKPETMIWFQGAPNWIAAIEVPELQSLFPSHITRSVPPPNTNNPQIQYSNINNNLEPKPDDWLVWSIIVTVICCIPTGVLAILESTKVDKYWLSGDYDRARRSAENVKIYVFISLGLGAFMSIISFLFGIMASL